MKAIVPVEVVVDDVDESEDKGELRKKGSINLAHMLSSAFAHNSADPKVAGGNLTASHLDTFTHDPPDQPHHLNRCVHPLVPSSFPPACMH
jgi:hypothetical protein